MLRSQFEDNRPRVVRAFSASIKGCAMVNGASRRGYGGVGHG